jgi:hypothetical protein
MKRYATREPSGENDGVSYEPSSPVSWRGSPPFASMA